MSTLEVVLLEKRTSNIRGEMSYFQVGLVTVFFFFKQKTAYEIMPSLVGSEMCIRDGHGSMRKTLKIITVSRMQNMVEIRKKNTCFVTILLFRNF